MLTKSMLQPITNVVVITVDSLDDRIRQLIPFCFKSMPHFMNRISRRGVVRHSLSVTHAQTFSMADRFGDREDLGNN
ncbi:hypothetical protein TNCV_1224711 [Trichonephila clavipes]|nr:hypothetical protein TNCV_1224711 [Trichonephila clavipes]